MFAGLNLFYPLQTNKNLKKVLAVRADLRDQLDCLLD